jgi:holo-[acyl-carrier protein] synthase
MSLRVGIDLVSVGSVEESLQTHAEHYLQRVYTEREVEDCRTADGVAPARLAARFAAKEATIKVLRPGAGEAIPWRSVELRRDSSGAVGLELSGRAAALAEEAGIEDLQVSITHEDLQASAVVIAELRSPCR